MLVGRLFVGAIFVLGGLLIFAGLATRYACSLMFAFMPVATFTAHRFWSFADPAQFRAQQSQFFNNVSIFGAFILIFAIAPGRCSLDAMIVRRRKS